MLHDADAAHIHRGRKLVQRAALSLEQQVEQEAASRIRERLEHPIVVLHAQTIGNLLVTCQASER